ncbi:hypothetical protein ACFQ1E_20135 [Sphingomonas canadensis]|uniref:Serine kinase n=1 Tax=Sphingomonas canadensis TaxID=1219257 RepID=A0ABW3HDZ7_9SPHN|nr:hypothetical protein [Sphingomonas canadensis]MCW3838433.1 hypothetical protein [Sphingomonas canadensis]
MFPPAGALRRAARRLEQSERNPHRLGVPKLTAVPPEPYPASRCYRLFGLVLRSWIALPELIEVPDQAADVTIRRGHVSPAPIGPRTGGLRMDGDAAVLEGTGVRYRVERGDTITVDADPEMPLRDVRLYLLGSAMGALLHQRGILPVHANAIVMGERAIAFAGRSGAGKSTLAAALHDAGHALLSDDVCAVTAAPDGGFLAQPGIARIRLWRDAVERSGRTTDALEIAYEGADKFVVPLERERATRAYPLAAVFFLSEPEADEAASGIRPLPPREAAERLIANTYRGAFVPMVGDQHRYFATCLALARSVPMFTLGRSWDAARIGETVALVEGHLARETA